MMSCIGREYHTPPKSSFPNGTSRSSSNHQHQHHHQHHHHHNNNNNNNNKPKSPLSIIEQWQRDAKGAVEDAYANYVLKDDTGESARLILVASPADDLEITGNATGNGNGNHPPHILLNDPHTRGSSSRSSRNRTNASNHHPTKSNNNSSSNSNSNNNNNLLLFSHRDYYTDANRQSSLLVGGRKTNNKHDPHASSFTSCGVTFVEINGRAYVNALDEDSDAYRSGVRPKDCVQYAAVLAKLWGDPLGADFENISSQALEREDAGHRITFEELKRVFLQGSGILGDLNYYSGAASTYAGQGPTGTNPPNEQTHSHAHTHPDHPYYNRSGNVIMGPTPSHGGTFVPPLPTTIRIAAKNPCGALLNQHDTEFGDESLGGSIKHGHGHGHGHGQMHPQGPLSVQSRLAVGPCSPSPVVLVFRRTRQRAPKAWNVWPNYRLDDECEMACRILQSLTTGTATTSTNTSNGNNHPTHANSHPNSPSKAGRRGSYDYDGSASIDIDDETSTLFSASDTSTAYSRTQHQTPRVLFSTDGKGGFSDAASLADLGRSKNEDHQECDHDADNDNDNDCNVNNHADAGVEASTLRGMIAKAVGLAFVRSNKVVFGVSLHGGSGIVLARLSDGTWSSPSLIGMGGVGLGLQVGLEVASYIFVLQTQEALEHFSRGGSFTLGANVGAALASMCREAIGAASVSGALCGMAQPVQAIKEDEYNFENDEEELEFVLMEDEHDRNYDATGANHSHANGNANANANLHAIIDDDGTRDTSGSRRFHRRRRRRRGDASCAPGSCHGRGGGSSSQGYGCVGDCTALASNSAAALEGGATRGLAPIVAYAKSEGLYLGVSLEGSRMFARPEANARAYKYTSYNHKAVTARDILTGKIVARPPEAEYLYALLHAIELAHEWASLPVLPKSRWLIGTNFKTNANDHNNDRDWARPWHSTAQPYGPASEGNAAGNTHSDNQNENEEAEEPSSSLVTGRHRQESKDLEGFSETFRDFLFGGITVTRISPNKREQRTLWLSSPALEEPIPSATTSTSETAAKQKAGAAFVERGSLRVGFVSKLYSATAQRKHLSASIINDVKSSAAHGMLGGGGSVHSEMGDELTLDSALLDNQSLLTTTGTLQERVELSKKLSMNLVDVVCLAQKTPPNFRLVEATERDRIICLEAADNTKLVFVGKTVEETRLLYCGLKILLEKETARMGIRGGQHNKSSKKNRGIMSALKNGKTTMPLASSKYQNRMKHNNNSSGYASSDIDDTDDGLHDPSDYYNATLTSAFRESLPQGWKSWGRVPGRSYMRAQSTSPDDGYPTYAHGQLLIRDVCKNFLLPLPLPLCRVLLLDSSSPVIAKWESERGDTEFERTPWTFPPATPREMEQFQSEHQLIASGSMCGAHRTFSYQRHRNGRPVRLSETHIVDSDDSDKLAFQVNERLPRRGFSIKVNILLRAVDNGSSCEATVLGEIRPVGKNMSDPAAVHKALQKVLEELRNRYGTDCVGLMAGFMSVVDDMPKDETKRNRSLGRGNSSASWRTGWEEKKESDGGGKLKILGKTSIVKFEDVMNANVGIADVPDPRFAQESRPSNRSANDYKSRKPKPRSTPVDDTFTRSSDPVTIEVKPLPKIRLSLMPSPREEDEEDLDDEGEPTDKLKSSSSGKKSKSSAKRSLLGKKKSKRREK